MSIFHELYIESDQMVEEINSLSIPEKIFAYLMHRAILPFNQIYREQNHRYSNDIIHLFEFLYENKNQVEANLLKDIETFLVYLWACNGIYFQFLHSNNKNTPKRLNLQYLTETNLLDLLTKLNYSKTYQHLLPFIFDPDVEPNMEVSGSIEKSGNNYYQKGFTHEHYQQVASNQINLYFELDEKRNPRTVNYSEKFRSEHAISMHWLTKALEHACKFPEHFGQPILSSLVLLIKYLREGDEISFKNHCIQWLKTNNRLDYNLGYIEQYHDPMKIRGHAGGEITIKTVDMAKITPMLLAIEQNLPHPLEYKKDACQAKIMNVSINKILYSAGDYGPLMLMAAYCLPNYNDIRAEHGSKQIIYKRNANIGKRINPELYIRFRTKTRQELVDNYDFQDELYNDLWDIQVLLHETIGHGSGRQHIHFFEDGDNLTIGNNTHQIGDTIEVTDQNYDRFITANSDALEELRAEIHALYMSIAEMDILDQNGLFKNWVKILGKEKLKEHCIIEMCQHIFRRLIVQDEKIEEIKGAHACANTIITNYLLDKGGIEIVDETKLIDDEEFHLLDIAVTDFNLAFENITKLVQLVQTIKSTANMNLWKQLFDTYTKYPITMEKATLYRKYMIQNLEKIQGKVRRTVRVYPNFIPELDATGEICDLTIGPEQNIFEQNMHYRDIMMSTAY